MIFGRCAECGAHLRRRARHCWKCGAQASRRLVTAWLILFIVSGLLALGLVTGAVGKYVTQRRALRELQAELAEARTALDSQREESASLDRLNHALEHRLSDVTSELGRELQEKVDMERREAERESRGSR
jgi:hypothetical protein